MKEPSESALNAVHMFVLHGKDHEGKDRAQCTVGGQLVHTHIDSRLCTMEITALALLLDAFAAYRVSNAVKNATMTRGEEA